MALYNSYSGQDSDEFPTHGGLIFVHTLDETLYGSPSVRLEPSILHPLQQNTEEGDNLIDELIEDMVGESFGTAGNDDWKEVAWQRTLRRQSKIKLRRRKH